MSAIDIGCGSGLLISGTADMIEMRGVDMDPDEVMRARVNGLDVVEGDGLSLPFPDNSFDLAICSFYLMWVKDIDRAIMEARRVAVKKVIFLSEPIWSKTLTDPPALDIIVKAGIERIRREGGDVDCGSSMLYSLRRMDVKHRYGTIPMDSSPFDVESNVIAESDWAGVELPTPEPVIFRVPLIWAAIHIP